MSTTFSRKKRISKSFKKTQENQRGFRVLGPLRSPRKTFESRNDLNLSIRLTGFKHNERRRQLC
jgi:hypothetical protein